MYVCVCNAVTERHIENAVEQGARRMRDLHRELGVSAECGRCARCAHQCLKSALGTRQAQGWNDLAERVLHALPIASELAGDGANP